MTVTTAIISCLKLEGLMFEPNLSNKTKMENPGFKAQACFKITRANTLTRVRQTPKKANHAYLFISITLADMFLFQGCVTKPCCLPICERRHLLPLRTSSFSFPPPPSLKPKTSDARLPSYLFYIDSLSLAFVCTLHWGKPCLNGTAHLAPQTRLHRLVPNRHIFVCTTLTDRYSITER